MKALIVGGSGFVGGYLIAELLCSGVDVHITVIEDDYTSNSLTHDKIHWVNILEYEQLKSLIEDINPDWIFHLAAQSSVGKSWTSPTATVSINVNGAVNLFEAVKAIGISPKILLIGSSEQYGKVQFQDLPVTEETTLHPANPYAVSKQAQEQMARVYVRAYGMNIVYVRAFNHIGPGQNLGFVVPDFCKQIVDIERGTAAPVLKVGDLSAKRDFTDVRDIVAGYHLLMKQGKMGNVYNIGSGKSISIANILEKLLSLTDSNIRVEKDLQRFRPSENPDVYTSNQKINKETNWKPEHLLDDSLKETLEWWREQVY
ncbi:MAG: GDP-mannose 4,6-dehydratase [Bacteroidetes bacterium]|nr:GDP-mannose 4,6-dehydratase [Bacteroidota bacterium]